MLSIIFCIIAAVFGYLAMGFALSFFFEEEDYDNIIMCGVTVFWPCIVILVTKRFLKKAFKGFKYLLSKEY